MDFLLINVLVLIIDAVVKPTDMRLSLRIDLDNNQYFLFVGHVLSSAYTPYSDLDSSCSPLTVIL